MADPSPAPSPTRRQVSGALPRETRDTLFLLAVIAACVAPHADHLPIWCSVVTALMLLWRGALAWRGAALPGRWSLVLVLGLTLALTWLTHRTLLGREAGITMLVMLMALKTLELRARRDAFVVFFLGFFLVLTRYFFSQSLLSGMWTLLCVWALLSALVLAQLPLGQPSLKLAARTAAVNTLWGLPVMLLLFLLFPRIAPLWGVPSESVGQTGLSEQLVFGAMSEIANDERIALRLRFDGPAPPASTLYIRGPVLSDFDGKTWRPRPAALVGLAEAERQGVRVQGPPTNYQMTLEPPRIKVLPTLEFAAAAPGTPWAVDDLALQRSSDLQWRAERPITERLRFRQQAYARATLSASASAADLSPFKALPPGSNPRTRTWANDLRHQPRFDVLDAGALPPALAAAVLEHLRTGDYLYTLTPGRYGEVTPDLIDEFWFDRRLGFCEHFASAFVFIMRSMSVPARIVTGYQGADELPQDGDIVVRNSHAHAWAEYWTPGQGWLRADPTAAVAPNRVLRSQILQPAPGFVASALATLSPDLLLRLRHGWENINKHWQDWVLNYSRQSQFDVLGKLGWAQPDWQALGQLISLVLALLIVAAWVWTQWQQRPHDRWTRMRLDAMRQLRKLGIPAAPHQSPAHWAALLTGRFGAQAQGPAVLLTDWHLARYAGAATPLPGNWTRQFKRACRMLASDTSSTQKDKP
ncbi:MAG: DUF3488 domain-containing transglutaminase family protein [Burkholderiaceae bacterium]|nr:DUF3488 domain-containing transglutaminase family protein [Burkholderiaceae bacterium]